MVHGLELQVQGYQDTLDFQIMHLDRTDIVLGRDWLYGLGPCLQHSYQDNTLSFEKNGARILLRGEPQVPNSSLICGAELEQLIDHAEYQRKLPLETVYVEIPNSIAGWHAIKDMVVRGAPAIAIAAALSLAVEVANLDSRNRVAKEACEYIQKQLEYLVSSRPTAVNLFDAAKRLKEVTEKAAAKSSNADDVYKAYVEAAEAMLAADVAANKAIGIYGAKLILDHAGSQNSGKGLRILTHCNTGSLATAAYGTALGVIRTLRSQGLLQTVYFTETRPFNQGSRLTAYELIHDRVPAILIADSAAASLQSSGQIDAVIVGADRIAANGDTANKIGTYSLALSAFHHNVPFYVAAPVTTLDKFLPSGKNIVIEERSSVELTHSHGGHGSQIAPSGVSVWNPAFDVTPAKLITAIITDKGIITKQRDSLVFDIEAFLSESNKPFDWIITSGVVNMDTDGGLVENGSKSDVFVESSEKYYILNEKSVTEYIKSYPKLAGRLGGTMEDWKVREVGDGNLNFVFIILGPGGSLVLKQSLPYVRCVGESWPMTSERSFYEVLGLLQHGRFCPDHVPEVYHFNRTMATIVMQYLQPPSIILRKGLIAGIIYPHLAEHMSDYMARTLYHTSLIANSTKTHRSEVAQFCGNIELCRLTEQVIFTEPYMIAQNNRWTSPQLDEDAKAVREDYELKLEIADLKAKFCERSQALIHGDLHTGSIMVTTLSTYVIDPEFAFYGPIGFDVGAFLGNLILAFFSQDGHAKYEDERKEYKSWILSTIGKTWSLFYSKFISLWNAKWDHPGDAYPADVYKSATEKELAQTTYMKAIFHDSLGYAAAKMIRRIVGIAHVEDFESIQDSERRAVCERRALECAKKIMKQRHSFSSIGQVVELVSGK